LAEVLVVSVTVAVTLNVPVAVGVPLMVPPELMVNPLGKPVAVQEKGLVPPVSVKVMPAGKAAPWVAAGREAVVMDGSGLMVRL
jgi:hypothetical protein